MTFSRRMFLRQGVMTAAACAGSPLLALSGNRATGGNDEAEPLRKGPSPRVKSDNWQDHASALNNLDRSAFSREIGTQFKVMLATGAPVWVTLTAVEDLPKLAPVNPASFAVQNKGSSVAPGSSGFVLVFGGSSPVPQGTHLFEHSQLGRLALFSVPARNGQQIYTAVVNRLDVGTVIPVSGTVGQKKSAGSSANQGVNAPAATSLIDENPSHALSGSQGARRGAVRD
ncbi:MAG TPA: hypothetical protein VGP89_17125 [Candidatus Angelobacter sp.]|nr:hypothetical protein [Candidatus Angelobacter sp.]